MTIDQQIARTRNATQQNLQFLDHHMRQMPAAVREQATTLVAMGATIGASIVGDKLLQLLQQGFISPLAVQYINQAMQSSLAECQPSSLSKAIREAAKRKKR